MKRLTTSILLLISLTSGAQTGSNIDVDEMSQVLKQVADKYTAMSDYSFNVTYTSYKGHSGNVIADKSSGVFKKSGQKMYANIMGMETVQDDKIRILTLEQEKLMFVYEPKPMEETMDIDAYSKALNDASKITKRHSGSQQIFVIYFKSYSTLEKMVLYLNDDLFITKVKLFYAEAQSWEVGSGVTKSAKPRLEINYSNFSFSPVKPNSFNTAQYVTTSGTSYKTTSQYARYELNNMILSK